MVSLTGSGGFFSNGVPEIGLRVDGHDIRADFYHCVLVE